MQKMVYKTVSVWGKRRRGGGREEKEACEPRRRWGRTGQRLKASHHTSCGWALGNLQGPAVQASGDGLKRQAHRRHGEAQWRRQCRTEPWGTKWRQRRHWGWPLSLSYVTQSCSGTEDSRESPAAWTTGADGGGQTRAANI